MRKSKMNWIYASLCGVLMLSACSAPPKQVKLDVKGVYDGYSYTSPYSLFTTHLDGLADMVTVKDEAQNNGASQVLMFKDTEGNEFQMMASFGNAEMDAQALLEQMVKQGQDQGRDVVLTKNADEETCLFAQSMLKEKDQDKGFGVVSMIFIRQGIIYDLSVKSKPEDSPQLAAETARKAFGELWNRSSFRGRLADLDEYPEGTDPRIPAITAAAGKLAKELGYEMNIVYGKKTILRIIAKGQEDSMTYSLGLVANGEKLITTEAVACKANDMPAMQTMQTIYYKELGQTMADEKLTITRSQEFDPDLAILPVKK